MEMQCYKKVIYFPCRRAAGMRDGNKAQTNPIIAATGTDTYVNFETPFASKMAPAISGKIAIFKKMSYQFSITRRA
jgi:hypothetical protein